MAHIDPVDPAVWEAPAMRRALAARDITTVYRLLRDAGVSQRQLAALVGQSQSEVSEILAGRQVKQYDTLVRIADGLGVERGRMGLAYTPYSEEDARTPDEQEVDEDVKRRNFINAVAGAAVWGHPVLIELLDPPRHTPTPLPRSLRASDVAALRDVTGRMRAVARHYGGQADTISGVAHRYTKLMSVHGVKQVKTDLGSALAELHTMAGWAAFDSGAAADAIRGHFSQAVKLAGDAGDAYQAADALYHSGGITEEQGHPNDALKLFQLAGVRLRDASRDDPQVPILAGWLRAESASALIHLDRPDLARTELTASRAEWSAPDANEQADMEWLMSLVERDLGRIDVAEALAASSIRHWSRTDNRRDAVLPRITLAELHLTAREPDGAYLAKQALDGVAELRSSRAYARLAPLETALLTRRDSACADLARQARAVRLAA